MSQLNNSGVGQEMTSRPTLSRRTVVAGAAWAVPTLTVAAAAPRVAASEPPCLPSGGVASTTVVWDVKTQFTGCTTHADHPDYVLRFNTNALDCPTCSIGGVSRTVNAFRITVTLNHAWGYWEAWTSGESLTRTYYLRTTPVNNCVDPRSTPKCTVASYTTVGIPSNSAWSDANAKCSNTFIVVPNSGDSFYDCHTTNAVDDGIHLNPCWWDSHTTIDIGYSYQAGYESAPGSSPVASTTFVACAAGGSGTGTISIPKP